MSGPNQENSFLVSELSFPRNLMNEDLPSLSLETLSIAGKSHMGTAFVPGQFKIIDQSNTTLNTFKNYLGDIDKNLNNQGYLGGLTWLESGGEQLSFCRILGNSENSGFYVGSNILSGSSTPGVLGSNPFSKSGGVSGKTYFFGKILSASLPDENTISGHNDYFEQIGYPNAETLPIITHVIMTSSGTVPALKTHDTNFNSIKEANLDVINNSLRDRTASSTFGNQSSDNYGALVSKLSKLYVEDSDEEESDIIYLNGLSGSNRSYRNDIIVNAFDNRKIMWQDSRKLNVGSFYQIDRGNYLYAKFPCKRSIFKEVRGDNITYSSFILSGSSSPGTNQPDYEDFRSPFQKAKSPWVVSQVLNREKISFRDTSSIRTADFIKLFRFHTYDDGEIGNRFRIRITPLSIGKNRLNHNKTIYSTFSVELYEYIEETNSFKNLFRHYDLNLDPKSKDYIGRVIGTEFSYYDELTGKIITKGDFRQTNPWVYIEVAKDVHNGVIGQEVIPAGFEEYPHININKDKVYDSNHTGFPSDFDSNLLNNISQTPIEFVHSLYKTGFSTNNEKIIKIIDRPYWGISFDNTTSTKTSLKNKKIKGNQISDDIYFDHSIIDQNNQLEHKNFRDYRKFFKNNSSSYNNTWVEEDFQNSFFHLEKILVIKENDGIDWKHALYRRDGKNIDNINSLTFANFDFSDKYEYLDIYNDLNLSNSRYLSFDMFTYGGFDGLNIFDKDEYMLNNVNCIREEKQSINKTSDLYNTAINLLKEYSNCTTDILSVPGMGDKSILNNFGKLNDTDLDFLELKELTFSNTNNFITGSIVIEDKSIFEKQDLNLELIDEIRLNSKPNDYLDYIISNNKKELIVYNDFLANVGYDNIHVGSSIPTIKLLAINKFGPLDSNNLIENQDNTTLKFTSILDLKYSSNNTVDQPDSDIQDVINKGINSFTYYNGNVKLSSSNSTFDIRKNSNRQIYNFRILNSIKKEIRLALFRDSSILFDQNSSLNFINFKVKQIIERIMEKYRGQNIIKNYYTKVSDNHNIKKNIIDLQRYILRGSINIELYSNTSNTTNMTEINLQDILSDLSLNADIDISNIFTVSI